ncbi:MarR family transcriptional regulator [Saccharopolyspora cebuensis]|uniref:MarR family transcriptional regulator n=1 Tax=Saccharopolyspora cebuensis TaxID=418759 RepID=A0ABV4CM54_9PSEU
MPKPVRPERSSALARHADRLPPELPAEVEAAARALVVVWGRSSERLKPTISAAQLRALVVVDRHRTINLVSLADELGSTPSVASRLCDRLQAAGVLERGTSPGDRREVVLRLSQDGRRLLRRFHRDRRADLDEVLLAMVARSRTALLDGLNAFHLAATELGPPDEEFA